MESATRQALRNYPSIAAARSTITAAGYERDAARWLRFPSAGVEAVTRHGLGSVEPSFEVVQPLWTAGRIGGAIDRADAVRDAAFAALDETALDILLRVVAAYHDIVRTDRLITIYGRSLAEHTRLVDSMERRVEQQVSPRTDLELARARRAQVEQELGAITAQNEAALRRLRELVGDPAFEVGVPAYVPALHHPDIEDPIERAVACSPTIRRLHAEVTIAEADRRLTRAAALPQVGLQYSYDRFAGSQVGVVLRAQTSGGLSPLASAQAAGARRQAAVHQVGVAHSQVEEALALDLVENRFARTRIESGAAAAASTANVTESFLRQFVAGRRTWLDVMNAVREGVAAQATLTEVEVSAMASAARLHLRTCDWKPATGAA